MLTTSFGSGRFRAGFTNVCFPRARPWLARPWLGPSWRGGGGEIFFSARNKGFLHGHGPRGGGLWRRLDFGKSLGPDFGAKRSLHSISTLVARKNPAQEGIRTRKSRPSCPPAATKRKGSGGERSGPEAVRTSSRASVRRRHHATKGAEVQGAEGQGRHALF